MSISHFSMLTNEFLDKDQDVVPEQAHLVILDSKSDVCMVNDGKDTKHTIHISIRINFLRNVEE